MKTIEEAAQEYADEHAFRVPCDESNEFYDKIDFGSSYEGFGAGVEFAQRWISVEEELPNEKNGYFDKQVLVKRFSDFDRTEIKYAVTKYNKRGWEEYSRITHWRPINFK